MHILNSARFFYKSILFSLFVSVLSPAAILAQTNPYVITKAIEETLNAVEAEMQQRSMAVMHNGLYASEEIRQQDLNTESVIEPRSFSQQYAYQGDRDKVIEQVLHNLELDIEFSFEYALGIKGQQTFEAINSEGARVSKLDYPHRGGMFLFKGEVGILSRFFIGGKYGSSNFKKVTSTDTDWIPAISDMVWNESNSSSKEEVRLYDINFYYRVFNFNAKTTEEKDKFEETLDFLVIDKKEGKLFLDVFGGYQQQKGRYGTTDLVDTVEWWTPVNNPINGEDSFYKIVYQGPRLGFRAGGSSGKLSTRLSLAYAWLKTKAYGWWNMRDYTFEQTGKRGYGLDFNLELDYIFTPHFLGGLGFNCIVNRQKKLKASGNDVSTGSVYDDLDIIRNANSTIYGPSVVLRFIW